MISCNSRTRADLGRVFCGLDLDDLDLEDPDAGGVDLAGMRSDGREELDQAVFFIVGDVAGRDGMKERSRSSCLF